MDWADQGCGGQVGLVALEQVGRAAQGVDHAGETLGGGAGGKGASSELTAGFGVCGEAGQGECLAAQGERHLRELRIDGLTLEHGDGFADLDRVARRVTEALTHLGEQGHGRQAGAVGDGDDAAGQGLGALMRRHEGAGAGLDVHDQGLQAAGELLGQDRGGDQRDALDRRGHVADGVEAAVGRREIVGLADDGAASLADDLAQAVQVGLRRVARDALQLVERAAGVAEAAAGEHRDVGAAGGEDAGRARG